MKLQDARVVAKAIIDSIGPYCERVVIAGSIRRECETVGDIELVAIPKVDVTYNLWGEKVGERSLLNDRGVYEAFGTIIKSGPRFVQVETNWGINLDLFVVLPPAQWGVIMAIRTGPKEFSQWLVTSRSKGGALHNGWRCEDGRVWDGQVELEFGVEADLFEWLELDWVEPKDRVARWNKYSKTYLGGKNG